MAEFNGNASMGDIAIIGMVGRFPGAKNMDEFWKNLREGVESVKLFKQEDLVKMGVDEHLLDNPNFVAADAILDDMDMFDASFFDYSAREAEIMDPQHRLFLESAWEVLEQAGYNSELYEGRVAVYAGANLSGYMIHNLYSNPGLVESLGSFKIMIANGQDFLATKVSYKMNLTGPSVNVNTLCSSSLVAVHFACQNLLNYGCDIALAGGVNFQVSRNDSFFYKEGGIGSPDGHCRAYDAKANGTVSGSGLAVVVLKRLEDAIADGDYIHAVIKGTGINNDGSVKNSYTAPNVDGQAECIAEAIAMSGVDPETITYIEGHGTGTNLGDPIEVAALTKVFRAYTTKKQFCALGSVKTNIGHLVNAGGLASLIKTVLAMKHREIPPSLNFEEPNPKIDFINSPFYVNTKLTKWETDGFPLRAGVSSFGIGGTNTHVILEEAPAPVPSEKSPRSRQMICLSAKTDTALEKMTENLYDYLSSLKDLNLADVAFTLHVGRRNFNHRRMIICKDMDDLLGKLKLKNSKDVITRFQKTKELSAVFMFPGEGSQYVNMGKELYETEKVFIDTVNQCSFLLKNIIGLDIRKVLYPSDSEYENACRMMHDSILSRTALFITEYALAKLLISLDIKPQYMIGEGVGEFVAACISEVLSVEDTISCLAQKDEFYHEKIKTISLNKPSIPYISSVTGTWIKDDEAVSRDYWLMLRSAQNLQKGLTEIIKDADAAFFEVGPGKKLSGEILKAAKGENKEFTILPLMRSADENCHATKRNSATAGNIGAEENSVTAGNITEAESITTTENVVAVGNFSTAENIAATKNIAEAESVKGPDGFAACGSDTERLFRSLGLYWLSSGKVNWNKLYVGEKRHRIPLPTYPFERSRYWIEPGKRAVSVQTPDLIISRKEDLSKVISEPEYKKAEFTVSIDLKTDTDDGSKLRNKLEEIINLKEKLELLCKEYGSISNQISISPIGLNKLKAEEDVFKNVSKNLKKSPRPDLETEYVPPRNEIEEIIVNKWQEVLGYDRIGIHDDFFELGGHSLIAAAVASDLSKVFNVQISLRELFETTTVAKIAELIKTYQWISESGKESAATEERDEGTI